MPYEWKDTAPDDSGAVSFELRLWPYRSMPIRGFVWFIAITAVLISLPVLAMIGTAGLWVLLPFVLLALWGVWFAFQRTYRSGESFEVLRFSRNSLHLLRHDTGKADREWQTNPYWVRAALREGPVQDYLTLSDGKRELELGAFLTPEERRALQVEVQDRLSRLR